jgi:hypothetical protein
LCRENQISSYAIEDYPDGIDLGCTEVDFAEFERAYGYRPETSPVILRRAFFAILSSTHHWKKFRGSGFVPAVDLEQHIATLLKASLSSSMP